MNKAKDMPEGIRIYEMRIADLTEADYNPRKADENDISGIMASLAEFGAVEPIVVNAHPNRMNVIVGGHLRVRALKEMGIGTVPAVKVRLTKAKERDLNLRLNRTGKWDWRKMAEFFAAKELEDIGFDEGELAEFEAEADVAKSQLAEGGGTDATEPDGRYVLELAFEGEDDWREAKENHVGADQFERTHSLMRHYAGR